MKSGDMQNHDYHETMRSSLVCMKTGDLEQNPGENEIASDRDQDGKNSKGVSKIIEVKDIQEEQEGQKLIYLKPDLDNVSLESDGNQSFKSPKKDRKQKSSR